MTTSVTNVTEIVIFITEVVTNPAVIQSVRR